MEKIIEKDKYLSEMIIEDEPSKNEDSNIEKSKTFDNKYICIGHINYLFNNNIIIIDMKS